MALYVMSLLTDVCDRLEIAGSLRRGVQQVSDIELVMKPKYLEQKDMFGEVGGLVNLLEQRCDELLSNGTFEKRLNKNGAPIAWGKPGEESRYKSIACKGAPVDLFIVLPDRQWGPTMLLRTGPGDANQVLVTSDHLKNREGFTGILPGDMQFDNGALTRNWLPLDTPEEDDVFAAIGLPYIPPPYRSIAIYQLWAKRRNYGAREDWMQGLKSFVPDYGWHEFRWQVPPAQKQKVEIPANFIDVAEWLVLTVDNFVGQRGAILGMPGMGKSTTLARLVEEMSSKLPMTIVDIENEYWSLAEGYAFEVAGRGELEPGVMVPRHVAVEHARALAREVYEGDKSVILCLLNYGEEEREDFLLQYFKQLWELAQKQRRPHTIVIDEAHEFVPQRGGKSDLQKIIKQMFIRGRKRGLGFLLASQRSAFVNKDVLNLCNILFLHAVQLPLDIGLYKSLLPMEPRHARQMIDGLTVGQAIVRRKGANGKNRADVYTVKQRRTRDIGATPSLAKSVPSASELEPA